MSYDVTKVALDYLCGNAREILRNETDNGSVISSNCEIFVISRTQDPLFHLNALISADLHHNNGSYVRKDDHSNG
jgi:hypothetical protein